MVHHVDLALLLLHDGDVNIAVSFGKCFGPLLEEDWGIGLGNGESTEYAKDAGEYCHHSLNPSPTNSFADEATDYWAYSNVS